VLHARFHPYSSGVINALESFALVTAALTLVGGFYVVLEDPDESGTARGIAGPAASAMIALINVAFLVAAVALLSKAVRRFVANLYARATRSLLRASGFDAESAKVSHTARVVRRAARLNSITPTKGPIFANPMHTHPGTSRRALLRPADDDDAAAAAAAAAGTLA
jgi:hypothetical protein